MDLDNWICNLSFGYLKWNWIMINGERNDLSLMWFGLTRDSGFKYKVSNGYENEF